MESFGQEALRYAIVLVTAPLWLPFVKALWKELNRALRWEGGLLGRRPTPRERAEIERAARTEEDPLVSEPRGGFELRPQFRAKAASNNPRAPLPRPGPRGPAGPRSLPPRIRRRGGFRKSAPTAKARRACDPRRPC